MIRTTSRARATLFAIGVVAASIEGCSSTSDHGAPAQGCPPPCRIGPGNPVGSGDGGSDATTDAPTDAASDVGGDGGEAGAFATFDVHGDIRIVSSLAQDPATGAISSEADLVARATRRKAIVDVPVQSGAVDLAGIDATFPITWILLLQKGTVRTIYGVVPDAAGVRVAIPEVPPETIQQTALALGATQDGGVIATDARATIVLQLLDAGGGGVTGATAGANPAASGPFYDDGADGLHAGGTTLARGTIAYLGVDPPSFGTVVPFSALGRTATMPVVLERNAVTWVRLGFSP